ncbi:rhodanese-related sulfurtransferase [Fulvivirgaceae bacterium BMA10]|uniref:tRNA uridine(34) hydroxylase n=1 Tax=Splendidivirga corallicola TaxID=3051826 RepID=A0ABT8KIH1_9BACT|nr:rhodanese-related sulfurtransferase [Fulvivirgaceae bacterium BMA10]
MLLHNRVNRKELKEKIKEDDTRRLTLSFYQYAHIANPSLFRDHLYSQFAALEVMGRIYVANEGVNAQISLPEANFEAFKEALDSIEFLKGIRLNLAIEDDGKSFFQLKIKVRKKIVADGLDDDTFDVTDKGEHLSAEAFNKLTDDKETIVVDMRNHYESEVGHFENAICPDVDTFREALKIVEDQLKDQKEKNIVMYCTGGIRCEKASAYYKHKGFEKVYQLEGGIIEYARQVEAKGLRNKFKGKNFVFDERLGERISGEVISRCHQCGKVCDAHTNCRNEGCHLLFIQCDECASNFEGCCSGECKEIINLPEEKQKELRKGLDKGQQIYRKGRSEKLLFKK